MWQEHEIKRYLELFSLKTADQQINLLTRRVMLVPSCPHYHISFFDAYACVASEDQA